MGITVRPYFLIIVLFCNEIYRSFWGTQFGVKFQGFIVYVRSGEKPLESCQIWKSDKGDFCDGENYVLKNSNL